MPITQEVLIQSKYAEDSQTTQYTSPDQTKTYIDKFIVKNTTGSPVTFTVNIVPNGDTVGGQNEFLKRSIPANSPYYCSEIIGSLLKPGDFISTLAGAATSLAIRAEGREIT